MSRSVWKGPFVDSFVLKKAEKARESGRNEVIKIWSRRSTILPQFVGLTFGVYNGKKHIPVNVTEEMIGQKFGEYSPTRTYYGHAARVLFLAHGLLPLRFLEKNPRRVADNEAMAVSRMLRTSPQKLNLVAALIRNKPVDKALSDLTFSKKRVAEDVKKTLQSAIANAENNHGLDVDDLIVAEAWVGKNMVLKRGRPRARGRFGKILKPFSQVTIKVRQVTIEEHA